MTATTTDPSMSMLAMPQLINGALERVRSEQQRATRLLAADAKCRRLSALYEHEARLWTLLSRHTAEHVYRRAAVEAQCAARGRAREYAELALNWTTTPTSTDIGGQP